MGLLANIQSHATNQNKKTKKQNTALHRRWGDSVIYKALLEGEIVSRCDTLGDLEICLSEEQRAGRKCRRHTEQNIFKRDSKNTPPPVFRIQWLWLLTGHRLCYFLSNFYFLFLCLVLFSPGAPCCFLKGWFHRKAEKFIRGRRQSSFSFSFIFQIF